MIVDSLTSAAKVCDCVVELRFRQNILCQPFILSRRCLAQLILGKATLDSGKLDLGLVSAGSDGIEP